MSRDLQNLKTLGKNLKAHRQERGLTQETLAELCELDPTYISLLERGKRNPAFLTLVNISRHLKCNVSALTENI